MTPQMGLASHAFSKCRKSFIHLISDITSTNIQLNEIERRHLQQLYLKCGIRFELLFILLVHAAKTELFKL